MRSLIAILPAVVACSGDDSDTRKPGVEDTSTTDTTVEPGNILILLIDDVGVDKFAPYGVHDLQPSTPNLDALADRGVLFRNAYASPVCSPTRASLLTGRYPSRTGVGRTIWETSDIQLHNTQTLLPEMIAESPHGYTTAAVGKWHLAGLGSNGPLNHPTTNGFSSFQGTVGNIADYFSWTLNDNGTAVQSEVYATTHQIDAAIDLVDALPEPWLIYVAFNAPHRPFHIPPASLHSTPGLTESDPDELLFKALVEAVDTEVGRLFSHMDGELMDRTTVMFLGDNGTGSFAITPPFDPVRGKDTLFDGGIHIPFVVAGPLVTQPGTESTGFVHVADIFHTVAEIARVDLPLGALSGVETDGISVVPYLSDPSTSTLREYSFSEDFSPLGAPPYAYWTRTVRDPQYKLLRHSADGVDYEDSLFEFIPGAMDEGPVLVEPFDTEQQQAYDRLAAELDRLDAALVYDSRL